MFVVFFFLFSLYLSSFPLFVLFFPTSHNYSYSSQGVWQLFVSSSSSLYSSLPSFFPSHSCPSAVTIDEMTPQSCLCLNPLLLLYLPSSLYISSIAILLLNSKLGFPEHKAGLGHKGWFYVFSLYHLSSPFLSSGYPSQELNTTSLVCPYSFSSLHSLLLSSLPLLSPSLTLLSLSSSPHILPREQSPHQRRTQHRRTR